MKKHLSLLAVTLIMSASSVLAGPGDEAIKQLQIIRDGKDNATYQIRNLKVMSGGSVALPASAVGGAELVSSERARIPTVTAYTATWNANTNVHPIVTRVLDSDGNSVSGRVHVTLWTSATAFGAPSAKSTGATTLATGTVIIGTNANTQAFTALTDTSGALTWSIISAATGQFYVVETAGGLVSSAAVNLQ